MNPVFLYLLLLKATLTTFSGLGGVPIVRGDLVVTRHAITDEQLNAAVAVGRTIPGPNGLYVVCVGYFAGGYPGAVAGTLALITPAFIAVLLLLWVGRHAENPVVRGIISAVLLAGSALLIATTLELAKSAVTGPFTASVAAAGFLAMVLTPIDTFWLMIAAAAAGLIRKAVL